MSEPLARERDAEAPGRLQLLTDIAFLMVAALSSHVVSLQRKNRLPLLGFLAVWALISGAVVASVGWIAGQLSESTPTTGSAFPVRELIAAGFVVPLGASMFLIRERHRLLYGLLEFVFALAIAAASVIPDRVGGFWHLSAIMAALYLIVRAMDNIKTGFREGLDGLEAALQRLVKKGWASLGPADPTRDPSLPQLLGPVQPAALTATLWLAWTAAGTFFMTSMVVAFVRSK